MCSVSSSEENDANIYDRSLNWVQFIGLRIGFYVLLTERDMDESDPGQLHYLHNVDYMSSLILSESMLA